MVRDRYQRHIGKMAVKGGQVRKVLAPVQGGHCRLPESAQQRKLQEVDVEMEDVEFLRLLAHLIEHGDVPRHVVRHLRRQPQGGWGAGHQARGGARIAAREQGHVMALTHEFFRQVETTRSVPP